MHTNRQFSSYIYVDAEITRAQVAMREPEGGAAAEHFEIADFCKVNVPMFTQQCDGRWPNFKYLPSGITTVAFVLGVSRGTTTLRNCEHVYPRQV